MMKQEAHHSLMVGVVHMICDYLGAGRAYYGKDFTYQKEFQWWMDKRKHTAMHPKMIRFIDFVLREIVENPSALNKTQLTISYMAATKK